MKNADNAGETIEQQKALAREIADTSRKLENYQTDLENTE